MTAGGRGSTLPDFPTPAFPEPPASQSVTDPEANTTDAKKDWETILDTLRRRYPGNRDSTLFCIFKLQQNPDLGLRDLRSEAMLHGLTLAGRSLHSARVLLGIESAAKTRAEAPAAETVPDRRQRRQRQQRSDDDSIEDKVIQAVRQIQDHAGARTQNLRQAIQRAITILQDAIDES